MDTNTRSRSDVRAVMPALSVDVLEQFVIEEEREISRHRANQLAALQLLDRAQVATADGSRGLSEWVAARLDIGHDAGKSLVRTMRRTELRPELRAALEAGDVSFDRIEAVSRVDDPGPDPFFQHLDISGVRREAANRARITADDETHSLLDSHLFIQPNLDRSWYEIKAGLDGLIGSIIDSALNAAADQLPTGPEVPADSSWRRAMGLARLCVGDEPNPAQISIFIDAGIAVAGNAEAGVYLEAGPRVGPEALQALMCDAVTEVTVTGEDGEPMRYGRRSRTIPPALRRAIVRRDGNRCVIDGCNSRHRLQVHHVIPWSRGGPTDHSNLMTVCWFHHHIAIHRQQLEPYRHPVHGRYRLRPTSRPPPS